MAAHSYVYNLPFLEEKRSCCIYLLCMHSALGWPSSWIICLLKKPPPSLVYATLCFYGSLGCFYHPAERVGRTECGLRVGACGKSRFWVTYEKLKLRVQTALLPACTPYARDPYAFVKEER